MPDKPFPLKLLSTDFDGTLHSELEDPPVAEALQNLIAALQSLGVTWIINTGRDLPSLLEALEEANLSVIPDLVVTIEREIFERTENEYRPFQQWNTRCQQDHERLFHRIDPHLPALSEELKSGFDVQLFEEDYSPFSLICLHPNQEDRIHQHLIQFATRFPDLEVVRNGSAMRFSHRAYHKGSALQHVCRHLGIGAEGVIAAGDHWNDLPMLQRQYARWLIAPENAIPEVKQSVERGEGYVSSHPYGSGVARGLEQVLEQTESFGTLVNANREIDKKS